MKRNEFLNLKAGDLIKLSLKGKIRKVLSFNPGSHSITLNKLNGNGTTVYCGSDCKHTIKINSMKFSFKKLLKWLFGQDMACHIIGTAEEKEYLHWLAMIAKKTGWELLLFDYNARQIRYKKSIEDKEYKLTIYYTTGTVGILGHGKRQVFVRRVGQEGVSSILVDPLTHING